MVDVVAPRSAEETLKLALDVCLGIGAFWVTSTGDVTVVLSDTMPPEDGRRRIEHLARNTLSHPSASSGLVFWNAEMSTEADAADRALACVVVPGRRNGALAGLLGVVDTWLPEPDNAQKAALFSFADGLSAPLPEPEGARWASALADRLGPFPAAGSAEAVAEGPAPRPADDRWFSPTAEASGREGRRPEPSTAVAPPVAAGEAGTDPPADHLLASQALRHLPDAVVVTRGDGTIALANERFGHLVGRAPAELVGLDVRSIVAPASLGAVGAVGSGDRQRRPPRRLVVTTSSGDQVPMIATDVRLEARTEGDADAIWFVSVLRPAPAADGCSSSASIDAVDLVGNLEDGVLCLDASGTVVLANRAAERFHGVAEGRTLVGSTLPDVSGLRTQDGQALEAADHPGAAVLRDGGAVTAQLVMGGEGDRQQHLTVVARPFPVDGHPGALVVLHDSTTDWLEQQRLTQYALYDPLTALANRYLLLEELRRMLLLLARQGGAVALVYLDLDGFKRINDEHGHEMGDEVLAAVARRLRGAVRSDDVVARLGGDEFVIAHASTERLPDGDLVVSRLRKVLSAPFRVRSQVFDVGASIGWVSTDRGEEGPEALLAKADRAMYLQKRSRAAARRAPS